MELTNSRRHIVLVIYYFQVKISLLKVVDIIPHKMLMDIISPPFRNVHHFKKINRTI